MATVAIYSLKGGVGKTTLAVNLAWCAAALSSRRTLLWDLDPQAASTWLIGGGGKAGDQAQRYSRRMSAPPSWCGAPIRCCSIARPGRTAGGQAFADLWKAIEHKLAAKR